MNRFVISVVVAVSLGACAEAPKAPPAASAASAAVSAFAPAQVVPSAPVVAPMVAAEPDPADVNAYKALAAERIAQINKNVEKKTLKRPLDARIAGLTVVGAQVLSDGAVDRVWVVRSSSNARLDEAALEIVRKSVPLPPPGDKATLGRGYVVYAESCIHRTDGKIQLVSKTLP